LLLALNTPPLPPSPSSCLCSYGLSWGVPGWIGDGSGDGLGYFSGDNIRYHVDWLRCAQEKGIEIDRYGIWNERSPSGHGDWIIALRRAMDDAGFESTRIVAADTTWDDIVPAMLADPELAASIDIVGAHYPSGPPPPTVASVLGKPAWASEMWNLGFVNDWPGAQRLMADLSDHAQWGLSTSIVWCLVYSCEWAGKRGRPGAEGGGARHPGAAS
jgi:hypothetical protein